MKIAHLTASKRRRALFVFVMAGLVILVNNAFADISGKVYDGKMNAGALHPLQAAQVIVRNPGTGEIHRTFTDSEGGYEFTGIDVTGYQLEALADSHWSVLLENMQNSECYIILPERTGDLTEMNSLHSIPIVPNGYLMSARRFGEPIKVYFWENNPDPWPPNKKQTVLNRMSYHEQITGKTLYEIVTTKRTVTEHGLNISYNEYGASGTNTFTVSSDIYNAYVVLANCVFNDAGASMTNIIDKEIVARPNMWGIPWYIPTCARSPPDNISEKDVMYWMACDNFRPVYLTVREQNPGARITSMADLTDQETPVSTQETSWGRIKHLVQ